MQKNYLILLIILAVIVAAALVWQIAFQKPLPQPSSVEQKSQNQEEEAAVNSVKTNESGLKTEIIKPGSGRAAQNGDTVEVNYTGYLENGTKFDSSIDRGEPYSFVLGEGRVIMGWDLGILGMKIGEKRKLTIPPDLAYGQAGAGNGAIPPNSVLIFEVELLNIK
ncbi:MAG: FKBP-type peptidyl-prolyl cis-trans isomerase [Patescibacteria group bacterium]|nr:FKBP-type peptidyl-prolyl cis-trans isomerase [Patescibacteria group bacterium]